MGVIVQTELDQVCRMFVLLSVLLLSYSFTVRADEELLSKNPRAGKMFLVSSSTSTTTVTTSTYCYTTNTVTAACGKRRKRAIAYIGGMDEDEDIEVSPSKVREVVESGEVEPGTGRDPRFVMYWMTTTSTSTSTSFSTTITLSALDCTPSGFALSLCG